MIDDVSVPAGVRLNDEVGVVDGACVTVGDKDGADRVVEGVGLTN